MTYILLFGAVFNILGGINLLRVGLSIKPVESLPEDYSLYKLFVAGVAVTFGALYIYLFFNTEYIIPFLVFGAALKTWALISSGYYYFINQISLKLFIEFGVSNGIIASLFWILILNQT